MKIKYTIRLSLFLACCLLSDKGQAATIPADLLTNNAVAQAHDYQAATAGLIPYYLGDHTSMALATVIGRPTDRVTTVHQQLDKIYTTVSAVPVPTDSISYQVDRLLQSFLSESITLNSSLKIKGNPATAKFSGSGVTIEASTRFLSIFSTSITDFQLMTNDDRLRILLRGILGISDADMKAITGTSADAGAVLRLVFDKTLGTARDNIGANSQAIQWIIGTGAYQTGTVTGIAAPIGGVGTVTPTGTAVIGKLTPNNLNTFLTTTSGIPSSTGVAGDPARLKALLAALFSQS